MKFPTIVALIAVTLGVVLGNTAAPNVLPGKGVATKTFDFTKLAEFSSQVVKALFSKTEATTYTPIIIGRDPRTWGPALTPKNNQ